MHRLKQCQQNGENRGNQPSCSTHWKSQEAKFVFFWVVSNEALWHAGWSPNLFSLINCCGVIHLPEESVDCSNNQGLFTTASVHTHQYCVYVRADTPSRLTCLMLTVHTVPHLGLLVFFFTGSVHTRKSALTCLCYGKLPFVGQ